MNHEHEPHRTNIYANATRNRKIKNGLLFDVLNYTQCCHFWSQNKNRFVFANLIKKPGDKEFI